MATLTTPHSTTATSVSAPHRTRLVKAAGLGLAMLIATGLPAQAATASPESPFANDMELAVTLVEPGIVFLDILVSGYVHDGYDWLNEGFAYEVETHCSGTIIDSSGYVLTAAHCVDPAGFRGDFIHAGVQEWLANGWHLDELGAVAVTDAQLFAEGWNDWRVEGYEPGSPADVTVDVMLSPVAASMSGGGVARARVVDLLAWSDGDVALLKIERENLPTVPLSTVIPGVGADIIAAGYPATVDHVTDPDMNAAYKDGRISQHRTRDEGSLPVWEISAAMSGGMSGGPTFDLTGQIVGVNSYGINGETQHFNFVSPVSLARELAVRNGISLDVDAVSAAFHEGLSALHRGDAASAVTSLTAVVDVAPGHTSAAALLEVARSQVVEVESEQDVPEDEGQPENDTTEGTVDTADDIADDAGDDGETGATGGSTDSRGSDTERPDGAVQPLNAGGADRSGAGASLPLLLGGLLAAGGIGAGTVTIALRLRSSTPMTSDPAQAYAPPAPMSAAATMPPPPAFPQQPVQTDFMPQHGVFQPQA